MSQTRTDNVNDCLPKIVKFQNKIKISHLNLTASDFKRFVACCKPLTSFDRVIRCLFDAFFFFPQMSSLYEANKAEHARKPKKWPKYSTKMSTYAPKQVLGKGKRWHHSSPLSAAENDFWQQRADSPFGGIPKPPHGRPDGARDESENSFQPFCFFLCERDSL